MYSITDMAVQVIIKLIRVYILHPVKIKKYPVDNSPIVVTIAIIINSAFFNMVLNIVFIFVCIVF
jgi:hypothetical protein